jgi:hypothetical protein
MAAAARTPVTVAADTWSAAPATATPAGSEVVTIRRVVIPVAPDADGAGSTQQITTALPQAPAPPATVTGSAPVTRSNGS